MRYYLIAGERSGDLHGSNLMKELSKADNEAAFRFFGGDYMKEAGGEIAVHYRDLAFMGFIEVLKNIFTIRKYIDFCKKDILAYAPDSLILIDYAGFNLRIAKWAKKRNIKVLYYISPKLWAWNQKRARKVKKYVDHMFVIMPFEVEFYKKFNYHHVSYVGNPVVDAINNYNLDAGFMVSNNIETGTTKTIAVLPGSRKQELAHVVPILEEVVEANPQFTFLIAAVDNLPAESYAGLKELKNVYLITGNTYDILANADAAIVTSGTATLETALWDLPQVVIYKGSFLSIFIARLLVKVEYISLVNLILNEECVIELIQENCTPDKISEEIRKLIEHPTDYSRLLDIIGPHHASLNAARGVIELSKDA